MSETFDAVVLGAGAAGLMCAIEAGKRGRRVAVLERAHRPGKKILISGGGRCNFTNLRCNPENFISANPHFAKSALARYTAEDFIALVEQHHIPYHEKTLGQLFCEHSAQDILTMLETECHKAGVEVFVNSRIEGVATSELASQRFIIHTASGEFRCSTLVVATGGLSIPRMGATSFGYDLAKQFGLKIREPRPALVPLLFGPEDRALYCDLAGVSAAVVAAYGGQAFQEKMLITHRGLSGPAILQISSYWKPGGSIVLDLAPGLDVTAKLRETKVPRTIKAGRSVLQDFLPARLATRWLDAHPPGGWTNAALLDLEKQVHNWTIIPAGTEGYAKAEVTAGGVDTNELSAQTMESRKVPGLFFVGEVVDVTGHLGGFNFQWAWSSGASTGRAL